MVERLQPDSNEDEAFEELVGELDPAPEAERLRRALGMDPERGSRDLPDQ